ncbi:MAG: hypothetical protein BGO24_18695 [Sphingomonas sp. 67-36]|nr:MAG: hypothetical protein BGO24_18695 [Sphingomonas sp. 67-36]
MDDKGSVVIAVEKALRRESLLHRNSVHDTRALQCTPEQKVSQERQIGRHCAAVMVRCGALRAPITNDWRQTICEGGSCERAIHGPVDEAGDRKGNKFLDYRLAQQRMTLLDRMSERTSRHKELAVGEQHEVDSFCCGEAIGIVEPWMKTIHSPEPTSQIGSEKVVGKPPATSPSLAKQPSSRGRQQRPHRRLTTVRFVGEARRS